MSDEPEPEPPDWLQSLLDEHGVTVFPIGELNGGRTVWACNMDCCCWFVIDDNSFLDRWSYVNDDGWCAGQTDCPCHNLPKTRPEEVERDEVLALKDSIDKKGGAYGNEADVGGNRRP